MKENTKGMKSMEEEDEDFDLDFDPDSEEYQDSYEDDFEDDDNLSDPEDNDEGTNSEESIEEDFDDDITEDDLIFGEDDEEENEYNESEDNESDNENENNDDDNEEITDDDIEDSSDSEDDDDFIEDEEEEKPASKAVKKTSTKKSIPKKAVKKEVKEEIIEEDDEEEEKKEVVSKSKKTTNKKSTPSKSKKKTDDEEIIEENNENENKEEEKKKEVKNIKLNIEYRDGKSYKEYFNELMNFVNEKKAEYKKSKNVRLENRPVSLTAEQIEDAVGKYLIENSLMNFLKNNFKVNGIAIENEAKITMTKGNAKEIVSDFIKVFFQDLTKMYPITFNLFNNENGRMILKTKLVDDRIYNNSAIPTEYATKIGSHVKTIVSYYPPKEYKVNGKVIKGKFISIDELNARKSSATKKTTSTTIKKTINKKK